MATNTQTVTGVVTTPGGSPVTGGVVRFTLSNTDVDTVADEMLSSVVTDAVIGADGSFSAALWPNDRGTRGTHYRVTVRRETEKGLVEVTHGRIQVGEAGPYDLADLLAAEIPAAEAVYYRIISLAEYNAALAARDEAEAALTSFEASYLGAKASDPATDNEGGALITGALYFNTTENELRMYDGAAWLKLILNGASLFIDGNGNFGVGATPPDGFTRLYTAGAGTQLVVLESTDGGAMQLRFKSDSGNRRFLAVDNSDNVEVQVVFENDYIALVGPTTGSDTWLTANANGVESGAGVKPASYTVATLPSASTLGAGSMIFVSDETGGATMAFSDGTDWRRVQDRAVVS